jgi:hypothetical protein
MRSTEVLGWGRMLGVAGCVLMTVGASCSGAEYAGEGDPGAGEGGTG